jgi:hypothetical protein
VPETARRRDGILRAMPDEGASRAVPPISVVMIDSHGDLGESMSALSCQGPPEQIELVLVTPERDHSLAAARYPELDTFGAVQVVTAGGPLSAATGFAAGIRAARAPLVAYCEEHALPDPGWAQARIDAHAAGATAVGAVLRNANPRTAVSRATFVRDFGPFAAPTVGGPSRELPWHQCSYRRDAIPLGAELDRLLETEGLLHAHLRAAGHQLVVESRCSVGHLNVSRWSSLLAATWSGGRIWGARRAGYRRWSLARRLLHCLLTPPWIVREFRLRLVDLKRVAPARRWRVFVPLAIAMLAHAMGEVAGVLWGVGTSDQRLADVELNRRAHLVPRETLARPASRQANPAPTRP